MLAGRVRRESGNDLLKLSDLRIAVAEHPAPEVDVEGEDQFVCSPRGIAGHDRRR